MSTVEKVFFLVCVYRNKVSILYFQLLMCEYSLVSLLEYDEHLWVTTKHDIWRPFWFWGTRINRPNNYSAENLVASCSPSNISRSFHLTEHTPQWWMWVHKDAPAHWRVEPRTWESRQPFACVWMCVCVLDQHTCNVITEVINIRSGKGQAVQRGTGCHSPTHTHNPLNNGRGYL